MTPVVLSDGAAPVKWTGEGSFTFHAAPMKSHKESVTHLGSFIIYNISDILLKTGISGDNPGTDELYILLKCRHPKF